MNTITFSDKNSFADFGLVLAQKEIGAAEAYTNYVEVPARDGLLDFTEAFGEVKYKKRKHTFLLEYIGSDADWLASISAFTNYVGGRRHKIFIEQDYYWLGRCFVGATQSSKGIRTIEVQCDCYPYKYRLEETIKEIRKNLFNFENCTTYFITNNNDGTFAMNSTNNYGTISVAGSPFKIGKTYTFSQYVEELQDSANSQLEYRVLMYYKDGDLITDSVVMSGANKRYSLELTPTKEVGSVDIMAISKDNDTTTATGVISSIRIEEQGITTILNDRKTVTPKITVIGGEPILSWADKKTGASFQNALPSDFNNKILDFKFYEGNNTFEVKGGDIRLTYQEMSL